MHSIITGKSSPESRAFHFSLPKLVIREICIVDAACVLQNHRVPLDKFPCYRSPGFSLDVSKLIRVVNYSRFTHQIRDDKPENHRIGISGCFATPNPERPLATVLRMRHLEGLTNSLPYFASELLEFLCCKFSGALALESAYVLIVDYIPYDNSDRPRNWSQNLVAHSVVILNPALIGLICILLVTLQG